MGEKNWLSSLKVSVAWHYCVFIFFCLLCYGLHQAIDVRKNRFKLFSCIEFCVQSYLIISAPCCVEHLSIISDSLCKDRLHERVDIFSFVCYFQLSFFDVRKNRREGRDYSLRFLFFYDPSVSQHLSVDHATFNVFFIHLLIKRDGGIEAFSCL